MRPIQLQRERDFGDKINVTFQFISQNAKPLFRAVLYIVGPAALIAGIAMGYGQDSLMSLSRNPERVADISRNNPFDIYAAMFTGSYMLGVLALMLANIVLYLVVCSYMDIYADTDENTEITVDMVWGRVKEQLLNSLGLMVLTAFVLILGLLLLIVPGIYLAVAFSMLYMILVREQLSVVDCLRRAVDLVKGKWWSTFGLIMITSIITSIVSMVFSIPALIFQVMGMLGKSDYSTMLTIFGTIISTVGTFLLTPIMIIAVNFQYFNLVERKDGTGLIADIENIGNNSVAPTTE